MCVCTYVQYNLSHSNISWCTLYFEPFATYHYFFMSHRQSALSHLLCTIHVGCIIIKSTDVRICTQHVCPFMCKLWSMYVCAVHLCLSDNFHSPSTAEDYDDRNYVVLFDVETQMGMLVVHANEDMILEDPEMFLTRLSIPSGLERVVEGVPPEAKITIIDRK